MTENSIELTHPKVGRTNTYLSKYSNEDDIQTGHYAEERKGRDRIEIGRRTVSLVERYVRFKPQLIDFPGADTMKPADKYISLWKELKRIGFNVVNTVRRLNDLYVAITDLAVNDAVVYDVKRDRFTEDRPHQPLDNLFVLIPIEEVEPEVTRILKLANSNGVVFPGGIPNDTDAIGHIVVRPEGSWSLINLDISGYKLYRNPTDITDSEVTRNTRMAEEWIRGLKATQDRIHNDLDSRT